MGPEVAPIGALIEQIRFADDPPVEGTGPSAFSRNINEINGFLDLSSRV
jgi:hypothetical protein